MNNVLLDELPTQWNGYQLDTDFQIGLQIVMIQDDPDLTDMEKGIAISDLLFEKDRPTDQKEIAKCISWYLTGWNHDNMETGDKSRKRIVDFNVDQWRIYSAFLHQYQIDLNDIGMEPLYDGGSLVTDENGNAVMMEKHMHFWTFMGLLSNLEECNYTRVIEARQKKPRPKADKEERERIQKAHKIFDLEQSVSAEDKEFNDHINDILG